MEEKSGVTFHEARVAHAREWVGDALSPKEVLVVSPEPTKEGITVSDKTEVKVEPVPIPESFQAARDIVKRFESGATRDDEDVADTVAPHMLQTQNSLLDEKWRGTEEEELNSLVPSVLFLRLIRELISR